MYNTIYVNTALGNIGKPHKQCIVAIYAITLHIVNNTEICCVPPNTLKQEHNMLFFIIHKTVSCIQSNSAYVHYTEINIHNQS
jgi:hypothetical protein